MTIRLSAFLATLASAAAISGCATPEVVQVKQVGEDGKGAARF